MCRSVFDEPQSWRKCTLTDGSPGVCPAKFQPQPQDDGSQVVFDAVGNITLRMPQGGFYFDPVYAPLADAASVRDIEKQIDAIVNYDTPSHIDKAYEEQASEIKALRESSDRALVGLFAGHLLQAGQVLRGWEKFLEDLQANPSFAHALLERLTEAHLERLERYTATVGQYLDVILFEDDLGMQGWAGRIGSWGTATGGYLYSGHGTSYNYSSYYYPSSFSSFTYEARLKRGGAAAHSANRILIRGNHSTISSGGHWRDYYSFQYSNEGKFSVWKRVNGVASTLQGWSPSAAVRANDWNTLKMRASGANFSFWINGTLVWTGSGASLSTGYVGVGYYASAGGGLWADTATLVPGSSAVEGLGGVDRETVDAYQEALNRDADRSPAGSEDQSE